MEVFELTVGLLFLAVVFWDVFETIVVLRPTPGRFRLGRHLMRGAWRAARGTVGTEVGATRDRLLGRFAPAATILLLVAWLSGLILVAVGSLARIVVVAAAASGLGIVALVVTFLFLLVGSYQRREVSRLRTAFVAARSGNSARFRAPTQMSGCGPRQIRSRCLISPSTASPRPR